MCILQLRFLTTHWKAIIASRHVALQPYNRLAASAAWYKGKERKDYVNRLLHQHELLPTNVSGYTISLVSLAERFLSLTPCDTSLQQPGSPIALSQAMGPLETLPRWASPPFPLGRASSAHRAYVWPCSAVLTGYRMGCSLGVPHPAPPHTQRLPLGPLRMVQAECHVSSWRCANAKDDVVFGWSRCLRNFVARVVTTRGMRLIFLSFCTSRCIRPDIHQRNHHTAPL
jgi:hypothetical protein